MILKIDDVSVSVEVSNILVANSVNVYKASFILTTHGMITPGSPFSKKMMF